MTASLGVPRLGDRMSSVGRGLAGRTAAASLAVLAIVAGTATYAWLAGLVPASFSTRGWMTGLLVADLVIAVALVALLAVRLTAALARSPARRGGLAPAHAAGAAVQRVHHHCRP